MSTRIAVNLVDLERVDPLLRQILLGGKLDVDRLVMVGKEVAVAFTCDLLTAAATCEGLRLFDGKADRYPTRVYVNRGQAWVKLSGTDKLVRVEGNKCALDRDTFPPEPTSREEMNFTPKAVKLGPKK